MIPIRHTRWLPAAIAVVVALVAPPAVADRGGEPLAYCHDEATGAVQRVLPGNCRGRIVSATEAAAIERQRRDYVGQAYVRRPEIAPGKRLTGVGSGFFINRDGSLLTNYHVVKDCAVVSVAPASGERAKTTAVKAVPRADLAVLETGLRPAAIAALAAGGAVSSRVALIGYPDQGIAPIKPLFTPAELLGSERLGGSAEVIKFKADVRPGNSGGPLLDESGNVVGVVFAKINTPNVYKRTGQVIRDIGYAIPNAVVLAFLEAIGVRADRPVSRAALAPDDVFERARAFIARVECWK